MSDTGRKDFSTQAKETLTPDSQKSTLDKAGESVTDAGDSIASTLQPGDSKSTTQKLTDTTKSGADDASSEGKGLLAQAQETVTSTLNSLSEGAANLASSITGEKK